MGARWSARFAAAALCLVGVALLTWLTWTAPNAADVGAGHERASPAAAPAAGGRTVRRADRDPRWSQDLPRMSRQRASDGDARGRHRQPRVDLDRTPGRPGTAGPARRGTVHPLCAYDRPGTYTYPDTFSRSDPVAMPRTTLDIVRDLNALLRAAGAPRPFVLAGHSFGGMVARLYATIHPRAVAGLVSVDAQNEDYAAALSGCCPRTCTRPTSSTHSPRRG